MKKVTRKNNLNSKLLETLEDRRLMSASVHLVDGMLVLQGKAGAHNRISVSPDSNGTTLFARADSVKEHYLISQVKTIQIVGGNKPDNITIDPKITKPSFIRSGGGADSVTGGSGSDTVMGGAGNDSITGGAGDDLLLGQGGSNKINAGNGDNPAVISPVHNNANKTSVTEFELIDSETNKVIATLTNGATINLAKLPARMNVEAVVSSGGDKGSVSFEYDGQDTRVENRAPFALAADNNDGDFYGWTPRAGTHTLSATPYAGKNASGAAGTALDVAFSVVDDNSAPEITSGVTPQQNTDNTNDVNAPVANIDLLESEVPAGTSVFANALDSTIKTGTVLTSQYEWNFGDSGSKYNTLTGFNVAHQYTNAGTYTITLKITDSAGKTDTITKNVTVDAAGRSFVYVSPNGNDANNGSSQGQAVKTFARASQLVGDNTEVLFERGATYNTSTAMNIGFNNVTVGAYGTGSAPVLRYTGGMDYNAILMTMGGKNVTVENVAFDSSSTTTNDIGYNDAIRIGGENITVRGCAFINAGYCLNTNGLPDGVLAQDNTCPNNKGIRAYFAWVQGADQVYLGNSCQDSLQQHNLRVGGADRVNIQYNNFTNLASTGGLRGTLTIHVGTYMWIANNTLNDATLTLGPLDHGAVGLQGAADRLEYVVVKNNTVNAILKICSGTDHVMVQNNVIQDDDNIGIDMPGASTVYDRGISDVTIDHNTVINNGTSGNFMKVGGPVTDVTVTNNVYVAPKLVTGSYNTAPMDVLNADLTGFKLIADNVWPSPTILAYADGGINYVGNANNSTGYKTPAAWEAYSVVQNDQFNDVTLTSSYQISLNGISAGAAMKKAA